MLATTALQPQAARTRNDARIALADEIRWQMKELDRLADELRIRGPEIKMSLLRRQAQELEAMGTRASALVEELGLAEVA